MTIDPTTFAVLTGLLTAAATAATLLLVIFTAGLHRAADRYARERQVSEELAQVANRAVDRLAAQHVLVDLKRMGAP